MIEGRIVGLVICDHALPELPNYSFGVAVLFQTRRGSPIHYGLQGLRMEGIRYDKGGEVTGGNECE